MIGLLKCIYAEQGCKPRLRNGCELDSTIVVQVNRSIVYEIEDLQVVEPKKAKSLDRRGVDLVYYSTWCTTTSCSGSTLFMFTVRPRSAEILHNSGAGRSVAASSLLNKQNNNKQNKTPDAGSDRSDKFQFEMAPPCSQKLLDSMIQYVRPPPM
jgi:hypothetical protein